MSLKIKYLLLSLLLCATVAIHGQNVGILPSPQQVQMQSGKFLWLQPTLYFSPNIETADFLQEQLTEVVEIQRDEWAQRSGKNDAILFQKVEHIDVPMFSDQAYRLTITENSICVQAASEQGLFYGMQSLKQLYRYHFRLYFTEDEHVEIPCMTIVDYPQLEWRGWMDDISRGPIATLDFMKKQIRILSEYKLNCFTLYTENTFKSSVYDYAPEGALTPEEIRELDAFAKKYHVELIGNQQCFAHFERILALPQYAHLADSKNNLNPALKETYTFLENILNEEMECYSSPLFNINCDETEALGTGAAAKYVKKVGAGKAYTKHINKVHDIIRKGGKKTLMWADIVLKDNEIQKMLPKDIQMLVWSYVPSDSFRQMIRPVKEAGFDFWVVPGVSMWSTVFPDMPSYEKNIANFARDGYQLGAKGLINTAWNDSGEALLNSAWHAFAWGAEMSWKPITSVEREAAERERAKRLAVMDTNFNFQFFHFFNNENIIADFLRHVTKYEHCSVPELYNTGSLWSFNPCQFFPNNLTKEAKENITDERLNMMFSIQLENLILSEEAQFQNPEIIYCAMQACNRMWNDLMMRKSRIELFEYEKDNSAWEGDPVAQFTLDNDALCYWLGKLQAAADYLWDMEYRPYWKDVNDAKYAAKIRQLKELRQHVFFETELRDHTLWLNMHTLFNDYPIHYTLDGSEPTSNSPIYTGPIRVEKSGRVRVLTTSDSVGNVLGEKELHVHLGMLAEARSETNYSNYRPEYSGGGEHALFDGETGSDSYRDGMWQGVQGEDVTVCYTWPTEQKISIVEVSFLQNYYDWILAPEDIEIYTSADGANYQLAKKQHFTLNQITSNNRGKLALMALNLHTRYLKVVVKNPGVLPEGHGGAGNPSFIFLDEIFVK